MSWNNENIFVDLETMEEVRIVIKNFNRTGKDLIMRRPLTDKQKELYKNKKLYKDKKQDGRI